MGIPTLLAAIYSGTYCRVIFDEAITATSGMELNGFTFVRDGTPETPTFVSSTNNAIMVALGGSVSSTLTVAYVGGSGTVVSVSTSSPAASFGTSDAYAYPTIGVTMRADAGQPTNDSIRIYFSQPVASSVNDLITGFTITVDGTPLVLTGATATLNNTLTLLTIVTGTNVAYSSTVDVAYDTGTGTLFSWPGPVIDFSFTAVPNLSTDGLPDSQYPLSWVTSYPVTVANTVATGTLGVSLNPIDIKLASEYGPLQLFTGGTFGITMSNPQGITVVGQRVAVIDGLLVSQAFHDDAHALTVNAVNAAKDWQTKMITQIAFLLGQARATDQGIVFNTQQVSPV